MALLAGAICATGYSLAQGSSLALVDAGATVSARVDTGSGFSQLLGLRLVSQPGEWYLRNSNTTGGGEINPIYGDGSATKPVAGDWNKDGADTIGVVN